MQVHVSLLMNIRIAVAAWLPSVCTRARASRLGPNWRVSVVDSGAPRQSMCMVTASAPAEYGSVYY